MLDTAGLWFSTVIASFAVADATLTAQAVQVGQDQENGNDENNQAYLPDLVGMLEHGFAFSYC